MKNERFINALKGGGITLAIIYSTLSIILEIANYFLFGKDIASYSFNGNYGKLAVFIIILIFMYLFLPAALFGSSNDVIEGKSISFSSFLQNGRRLFWRTLGFSFIYVVPVIFIVAIFSYFFPYIGNSVIANLLVTTAIQAILTPLIILNVIEKNTKGYIKKNYLILLIFSLIICSISLIPIVGKYFYIIIDVFYTLLIVSLYESGEFTEGDMNVQQ